MKSLKAFRLQIVFVLILLLFFGIGLFISISKSINQNGSIVFTKEIPTENKIFRKYFYISGEVQKPGVYEFSDEIRINDAIKMAGGFTKNADNEFVNKTMNLSKKIEDEEQLFIPSKTKTAPSNNPGSSKRLINLNTATLEQLDSLPGIGPSTAQKIIGARPFNSIEGLLDVSGIGESKFSQIKSLITVN